MNKSTSAKNIEITVTTRTTAKNACLTCTFVGNITLCISAFACAIKVESFSILYTFSVAGQEGFEPPTPGFGDRCSTVGAIGLYRFKYLKEREEL